MIDYSGSIVSDLPASRRAKKRSGTVRVHFACHHGIVDTLEGPVSYQSGDALITGDRGETWPVRSSHFHAAYRPVPGVLPGTDGLYVRLPIVVWAVQSNDTCRVVTAGGSVLTGKAGDWIVQYESGEYGIVEQGLFIATYEVIL